MRGPRPDGPREAPEAEAPVVLERRSGARPQERVPVILEVQPNDDYALLDSGNFR